MDIVTNYVRTQNGKKIVCFYGDRQSFRCRQRSKSSDGFKCQPLRFVSFKETQKEMKKNSFWPLTFAPKYGIMIK